MEEGGQGELGTRAGCAGPRAGGGDGEEVDEAVVVVMLMG